MRTNVQEIERTCDFGAVVTWVFGVKSPNRYRVGELTDPHLEQAIAVRPRHVGREAAAWTGTLTFE